MTLSLAPVAAGGAGRDAVAPRPSVASVPLLPLSRLPPKSNVIVAPRTPNGTLLSSRRSELEAQTRRELEAHRSWWHVADTSRVLNVATPDELKRLVEQTSPGRLVVVDYFSPSCNGCRALFPKVKALAAGRADLDVVQVDVSTPEWQAFCVNMGIAAIPWFHLFRDGNLLEGFPASLASLHKLYAQIDLHSAPPIPAALVA